VRDLCACRNACRQEVVAKAAEIQEAIADGSASFLNTEFKYIGVFMVIMSVAIFSLLSTVVPEEGRTKADETRNGVFSTIAFIIGGITSLVCGYLGMKIATFANARTACEARKGIAPAFMCGESWKAIVQSWKAIVQSWKAIGSQFNC
jgi:Na+/H+-translocating membrane pyrophosphatase